MYIYFLLTVVMMMTLDRSETRYEKDPETKRAQKRAKYDEDPESMLDAERARYEKDPGTKRIAEWARYEKDPETKRAKKRAKYYEDPESNREAERARYENNPDQRKGQNTTQTLNLRGLSSTNATLFMLKQEEQLKKAKYSEWSDLNTAYQVLDNKKSKIKR